MESQKIIYNQSLTKKKIPQIRTPTGLATTDSEKAEAFADSLEEAFNPNKSEKHLARLHEEIEENTKDTTTPNIEEILKTTTEELNQTIKKSIKKQGARRGSHKQHGYQTPTRRRHRSPEEHHKSYPTTPLLPRLTEGDGNNFDQETEKTNIPHKKLPPHKLIISPQQGHRANHLLKASTGSN